MSRHLLAAAVVAAETALRAAGHGVWATAAYAPAVALVVVLGLRYPVAAFVATLAFTVPGGGAYVLLLWTAYQAGRHVTSGRGRAIVVGAASGGLGVQLVVAPGEPRAVPNLVTAYLVFVALPLLAGRYLAQHQRLVSALDQRNRRLHRERELLAEQERLRERLRIARDMHDSLGRRLSLVSIQAAALEVSVPPEQRSAVRRLASAASGATDNLHDLFGTLRGRSPGVEAIEEVAAEFRAAGAPVALLREGEPRPLSTAAGEAAYRVVEEGLTNAARHAPGRPVTVSVGWEPDALLVSVVNPVPVRAVPGRTVPDHPVSGRAAPEDPVLDHAVLVRADPDHPVPGRDVPDHPVPDHDGSVRAGHGLLGLAERTRAAGGRLEGGLEDGEFRLVALLPVVPDPVEDDLPAAVGVRTAALGFVTAVLMFVVLPASMLLGVA